LITGGKFFVIHTRRCVVRDHTQGVLQQTLSNRGGFLLARLTKKKLQNVGVAWVPGACFWTSDYKKAISGGRKNNREEEYCAGTRRTESLRKEKTAESDVSWLASVTQARYFGSKKRNYVMVCGGGILSSAAPSSWILYVIQKSWKQESFRRVLRGRVETIIMCDRE